ncbi:MAG: NADH:ubiquinone reductase (Na(+)-transporting) subunit A [Victivallaceae bacterium]
MKLKIKKGFDIPIEGCPDVLTKEITGVTTIGIDLSPFSSFQRLKILVKEGQFIKTGEPIAEYSSFPGTFLTSSGTGYVVAIERGVRRVPLTVVIGTASEESFFFHPPLDKELDKDKVIDFLSSRGLFSHFSTRPFNLPATPYNLPRNIFINFSENSPFYPDYILQTEGLGLKDEICSIVEQGIEIVSHLIPHKPHLVYRKQNERFVSPTVKRMCMLHEIEGPYPSGEPSLHISKISPIKKLSDSTWILNFYDLIAIGYNALKDRYLNKKIIGVGGSALAPEDRFFVKVPSGIGVKDVISSKYSSSDYTIISGSPLTGRKLRHPDKEFLGFRDMNVCCFSIESKRESFYFMRLGLNKFTLTNTYLYKLFHGSKTPCSFTTNMHGEKRNFIEADLYDRFMPMKIPVIPLIKSILTENYDQAIRFGFLEVVPEDFALSTFVCPSKNELIDIVRHGIEDFLSKES